MLGHRRTIGAKWYSVVTATIVDGLNLMGAKDSRPLSEGDQLYQTQLRQAIESTVIPRLLKSQSIPLDDVPQAESADHQAGTAIDDATVVQFAKLLMGGKTGPAINLVDGFLDSDVSDADICMGLLAPAARKLGDWWVEDICTFGDVTVGLSLLHEILRVISLAWEGPEVAIDSDRHILLIAPPGEQHVFGINMVAQFFRRASWDAEITYPQDLDAVIELAESSQADIVGLTCSCDVGLSTLERTVSILRNHPGSGRRHIMVGGQIINQKPHLVSELGADSSAKDCEEAVNLANDVIARTQTKVMQRQSH